MLGQSLSRILFLLGVGFLFANLRILFDGLRFLRRRSKALLTWPGQRPPYYGLLLAIGVVLGILLFYKLVFQHRAPTQVFGEAMMFLYYSYAVPFSRRIGRGFYEDGIWTETGFIPTPASAGLRGARATSPRWSLSRGCGTSPDDWWCPAATTRRPAGCCATRSPRTTSTSAARG